MSRDIRELINAHLDSEISPEETGELEQWLKSSPENAREFARICRVHDALHNLIQVGSQSDIAGTVVARAARPMRMHWVRTSLIGGMAALVAITLALFFALPSRIDASTEINRLIASTADASDRCYVIRTLDAGPEHPEDRRPPIDGALLYVRRPNCFVLERHFSDGRLFVTGSDGQMSWAMPPGGSVHVSDDLMRFRGPVPGHQYGIPFADLRSDLVEMRIAYVLTVLPPDQNHLRGLHAEKKSAEYRGPRSVDIWYDASSGVIHRMVFGGMPRGHGSPDGVSVELRDTSPLPANFFHHSAHHDATRNVVEDDDSQ